MSQIKLKHSGGNSSIIAAPSSNPASDVTFRLPQADGSAGQFIKTDGSGNLSFEANLTFDGDDLLIKSSTDGRRISFASDGTSHYMKYDNTLGGIILNGYGGIAFETNGTNERMRIDSSGKVGIGTTSPNKLLHIQDAAISGYGSTSSTLLVLEDSGDTSLEIASGHNSTGSVFFGDTGASNKGQINYLHGSGGDAMTFHANGSERVRIDSGGDVGIGTTTPNNADSADGGLQIQPNHSYGAPSVHFKRANNGSTSQAVGFVNGSTGVGSITYTNGGTSFNTSSDYRLKENVVALSDGITRIKTLKPYRFNFIVDADKTVDGFLAHEVIPVVPEAITGEKDAVDSNNKPIYQEIDQAKLVPLLTAALQEAIAKIELLETKVAALETA